MISRTPCAYMATILFFSCATMSALLENSQILHSVVKGCAADNTAEQLAKSHGSREHEISVLDAVCIHEHEGNDEHIRYHVRERADPFEFLGYSSE